MGRVGSKYLCSLSHTTPTEDLFMKCYTAARDEDDDPAVYGSGTRRNAQHGSNNGNGNANGRQIDENSDEEDEDSNTLLTVHPGFNRLLLVLRDPGVLHFVKYISAKAPGSRWDICGEWEVGQVEVEDEEEEEEAAVSESNGREEVIEDVDDSEIS
jgi:prolyl 3-hydroxylase /prolyl 3,4-dihydroxylase